MGLFGWLVPNSVLLLLALSAPSVLPTSHVQAVLSFV